MRKRIENKDLGIKDYMADKVLLNYITNEFKRMDDDFQVRARAFVRWYKQFRGILDDKVSKTTKSRLFLNRTKVACMAGVANVMDVLFPSEDFFDVLDRTSAEVEKAENSKELLQWVLHVGDFFTEAMQFILQAAIYGTAFAKLVPVEIIERVIDKEPVVIEGVQVGVRNVERDRHIKYVKFELVDIFDMRIDPAATSIDRDSSSGLFHIMRRRLNYLRQLERKGIYKNIDDVVKHISSKKNSNSTDKRRTSIGLPQLEDYKESVEIEEYYGVVPADIAKSAGIEVLPDEHEVECIVTMAERTVIIRAERNKLPNQMRPFVASVWEPSGDRTFYGRGIVENVRGAQQALNATANLRLDNQAWAIAAPMIVNLDKIESPEDLVARVNWVIRGRGAPGDIASFVNIPNVTASAMSEQREFERHIEDESAINKIVQATESFGSNRTLGGISLAYSAASRTVRLIARGFEINLIHKGFKKLYSMLVGMLDDDIVVRITDRAGMANKLKKLSPLDIALDVDIQAAGSFALLQRSQLIENMQAFFDFLSKSPNIAQMPNWDWKNIIRDFHRAIGLRNFERWWIDDDKLQMMQQEQGGGKQIEEQIPGATSAPEGAEGAVTGNSGLDVLAAIGRMAGGGAGGSIQGVG